MATHSLLLQQPYFDEVADGTKTFEIRRDTPERHFTVGDVLRLREFDAHSGTFSGREITKRVGYISHADDLHAQLLRAGVVVLALGDVA